MTAPRSLLLEQLKEFRFTQSSGSPSQGISVCICDDRDWGAAYFVSGQQRCIAWIVDIYCQWNEPCVDNGCHLFISPHLAFHYSARNTPTAGKVKNNRLVRVRCLLLGRRVVISPRNVVGRDIETVPRVHERDNEEGQPKVTPEVVLVGSACCWPCVAGQSRLRWVHCIMCVVNPLRDH